MYMNFLLHFVTVAYYSSTSRRQSPRVCMWALSKVVLTAFIMAHHETLRSESAASDAFPSRGRHLRVFSLLPFFSALKNREEPFFRSMPPARNGRAGPFSPVHGRSRGVVQKRRRARQIFGSAFPYGRVGDMARLLSCRIGSEIRIFTKEEKP